MMQSSLAILGLGSNIGDRRMQLKHAVRALTPLFLAPLRCSPVYVSAALLPEHAPDHWNIPFLNMAACAPTALSPQALLAAVKAIEAELGRTSRGHWGPREIDIDILAYGDTVVNQSDLVIPHPGLASRGFALAPLADIAPDWRFPGGERKGETARSLAAGLKAGLGPTDISFCTTQIMGIVNMTPDSFSGDGLLHQGENALARVDALLQAGAAVIDIGAESTRPGALPVSAEQEWERLEPLLKALGPRLHATCFSIDTRHGATAQKALAAGVRWINDVGGSRDEALVHAVREHGATLVVMHSLGVPADPCLTLPESADPVEEVLAWGQARIRALEAQGLARAQLVFDPGIGFGKTARQSWELLLHIDRFKALGLPLLVGHSRKSFLSLAGCANGGMRDCETLAVSAFLARAGVDYLRVHDVPGHSTLLRVTDALL